MTEQTLPTLDNVTRPDLEIELSDGRVIKMTYGLEMNIRRLFPDPATIMVVVMNDAYTQDYIVRRCLTDKKAMIFEEKELVQEVDLTPDDTEKLLMWAAEHALYFFVKRAAAVGELGARYQPVLLEPSTNGSENSASKTPSVGPSDVPKEG